MSNELKFGLTGEAPDGVVAFGAMAVHGMSDVEVNKEHCCWRNTKGQDAEFAMGFGAWVFNHINNISVFSLDSRKAERHVIEDDDYCMVYDTKGSCGRVYITAWIKGIVA